MSTTRVTRHIRAPRSAVYRALLDRDAVQHWMVPDGMTSRVHVFEPYEGGTFRISLTYDAPTDTGKTDGQTDTFHGRFARLVRDTEVVQEVEFETTDPALRGEMTRALTRPLTSPPRHGRLTAVDRQPGKRETGIRSRGKTVAS